MNLMEEHHRPIQSFPRKLDLALCMMKLADVSAETFPDWTGCNILLQKEVPEIATVGYLPIVDASPTRV